MIRARVNNLKLSHGVLWQAIAVACLAVLSPAYAQSGTWIYVLTDNDTISVFNADIYPAGDPIKIDNIGAFAASPDGSRLYVTSGGLGHGAVVVVDTVTHAVAATINLPVHTGNVWTNLPGIAVTPDGEHVYVSDSNDGVVLVIETTSNTLVVPPIALGDAVSPGYPDSLVISPNGQRVYALDGGESVAVWVINTVSNTVSSSIFMSAAESHSLAISPDGTRLYASDDVGFVWVVDTASDRVIASILVGDANENQPGAMAVTPDGKRLFVLTDVVLAIDTATNFIVGAAPILYPSAIAVGSNGLAYVASGGAMWMFDTDLLEGGSGPLLGNSVNQIVIAPVPQATPRPLECVGDCNGDHQVTVTEILTMVNMALGNGGTCPNGLAAGVTPDVSAILTAVNNVMDGCR
jgi:YVTN family beta-propeller protein